MIFSKTLRGPAAMLCGIAAVTSSGVRPAHADTILKAGDRVVFYGDSITEQRLYTRYIQEYFYSRYPGMKVNFFNAGWGGDTTWGALSRIDRDVLYLKPTVVTLFFGMNDGGYTQTTDAITDKYRQNLEAIIKKLKAANVRVIVFTPGCVDPDKTRAWVTSTTTTTSRRSVRRQWTCRSSTTASALTSTIPCWRTRRRTRRPIPSSS